MPYTNVGYLNIAGAETGNLDEAIAYNSGFQMDPALVEAQSTTVRSGSYAYHVYTGSDFSGGGDVAYLRFGVVKPDGTQWSPNTTNTAPTDFYVRAWINVATLPATGDEDVLTIRDLNGALKCSVAIKDDGNVVFYDASRTAVGTGSTAITANTWTRLEVHAGTGSSAAAQIKINGTSVVSGTFNNTNACSDFSIGTERSSEFSAVATMDLFYDDIALRDDQYPADGRVKIFRPNATGGTAQWVADDEDPEEEYAGTDYNAVNEVPFNPFGYDAYIKSSTNGNVHLFGVTETAGVINAGPNCVKASAYPKCGTASTSGCVVRIRSSSSNADTTGCTWPTTQPGFGALVQNLQALNPNGAVAWTTAAIDSVQIGVVNSSGVSTQVELHAIYLMVDYTPVTTPVVPTGLTVAAQTAGGIKVSWSADANDGVYVERSTDNATWTQLTNVLTGQYATLNLITTANTLYYYRARGYIGASNSSYTSSVSATAGVTQPVTQYTDGFDAGSIDSNWTAQNVTPISGNWSQTGGVMRSIGSGAANGEKGLILSNTTAYRNTTGTQEVLCKVRLNATLSNDGRCGVYMNYQVGSSRGFMCGFRSPDGVSMELDVLDDWVAHHTSAFTPVIGRWYWIRAKVTTNNAVALTVWEDGTTEPGSVTYSITGLTTRSTNNYPGLAGAGNAVDFDEFIIITQASAATRTYSTDSLLKATTQTRTHTTGALLRAAGLTRSHTTGALLRATQTRSHTTGALLRAAGLTRAHATGALLRNTFTRSHGTNALLRATFTRSHTTGALLWSPGLFRSHATGALLRAAGLTRAHTTGALLRAAGLTRSHATGALLRATSVRSHSSDARLLQANVRAQTSDARLRATTSWAHTSNAFLKTGATQTCTSDSWLLVAPSATFVMEDRWRRGDWIGTYGSRGYRVLGATANETVTPADVTVMVANNSYWTGWNGGAPGDDRAPTDPGNTSSRVDNVWYRDGDTWTLRFVLADNRAYSIATYHYDQDHSNNRSFTCDVLDASGNVLATRSLAAYTTNPAYLAWNVQGDVTLRFTNTGGSNAVMQAYFLDPAITLVDKAHSTDSMVKSGGTKTSLTNALLRSSGVRAHSTDALLRVSSTRPHSTAALLKLVGAARSHSSDSYKRLVVTRAFTTDSRIGSLSVGTRSRTQRIGTRSVAFGDNTMKERQQSTANYPISVLLVLSSDHVTGTGTLTPTITISKNGGAWATPAGALSYDAYGNFLWAANATDRDTLGELRIHVTAAGCDPYDEKYEIVAYDPFLGANTQTERNALADTLLTRDWTAISMTVAARSLLNAARFLRNKWTLGTSGVLTVTKEDDVTPAWTAQTQSQSGADPITGSAPTS